MLVFHLGVIFSPFLERAIVANLGWNQSPPGLRNFGRIRLVLSKDRRSLNAIPEKIIEYLHIDACTVHNSREVIPPNHFIKKVLVSQDLRADFPESWKGR